MEEKFVHVFARVAAIPIGLLAVYLALRGDSEPGGGIVGGLVGAGVLVLFAMTFGQRGLRRALRTDPVDWAAGAFLVVLVLAGLRWLGGPAGSMFSAATPQSPSVPSSLVANLMDGAVLVAVSCAVACVAGAMVGGDD